MGQKTQKTLLIAHCVLLGPAHSDLEVAAVLLDGRHGDHSLCPSTVQNGSAASVPEMPTDTNIVKDMGSLTIANCKVKKCGPIFPSFYLDVIAEPTAEDLGSMECFSAQTRAAMDVFQAERIKVERGSVKGMMQGGEPYEGEQYEKGVASHGDSTFHKFYKQISSCPSQGLRLERSSHGSICNGSSDTLIYVQSIVSHI